MVFLFQVEHITHHHNYKRNKLIFLLVFPGAMREIELLHAFHILYLIHVIILRVYACVVCIAN